MTAFQILSLLLTFTAVGAYLNYRYLKLPATVGLMAFALVISLAAIFLNWLGVIDLTAASGFLRQIDFSAILLHGMLSFLLFAGALQVDLSELQKHKIIVGLLATVGVVIATFITGTVVWLAAGWLGFTFNYFYALLFGALIAPTDPVAVLGLLRQVNISKNFRVKISCESLLNDGVGVVLFVVLLNIANPELANPTPRDIAALVIWQGIGSLALGLAIGWIVSELLYKVDDYRLEALLTLAAAAGGYSLAEYIHVSAPITMVIAGLTIGNHNIVFGRPTKVRKYVDLFWGLLDEILNAVLFVLIGLEMMVITIHAPHLALGLFAIVGMLVGRFVSVAIPVTLMRSRYRFEHGTIRLLTWGGLRGGISIALALSLPVNDEKDLILGMTYLVVVFSILFQGTTFRHVAHLVLGKKPA